MDNSYERLLKDELKRLVKSRVSVTTNSSNYLINIRGKEIAIPRISTNTVRKNNIISR